ncbi:MAG: prolyl oligopeptidase family serine peptidase [Planctomycetota bacterium]
MKNRPPLRRSFLLSVLILAAAACARPAPRAEAYEGPPFAYPPAPAGDHVDTYHGVEVADPYRWLEEDAQSPALRAWIEAENAVTRAFLDGIPERPALLERLTVLWNTERVSVPFARGGRVFYFKNDGLQNQSVLFVVDGAGATPRVFLDPNTLSADGTIALADAVPSPDGALLAYSVSDGGSDWRTWRFRNVATGEDLPDVVRWNKFGGLEWTAGAEAVVYPRFPAPSPGEELVERNAPAAIAWHRMGTSQDEDTILRPAPETEGIHQWSEVLEDGQAVLVLHEEAKSDNREVEWVSLRAEERGRGTKLIAGFDAQYDYAGDDGTTIWFRTNLDAPRWRIVAMDRANPDRASWREVVPEREETMDGADLVGGRLVVTYLKDATSAIRVLETDGTFVREVALPGLGTAGGFDGEAGDPVTYYSFTNQVTPPVVHRYDVATGESSVFHAPKLLFRPTDYAVRQVFYASADGTRIPMFLAHKKGLVRDGRNPTYLYGYGGFNISVTPSFQVPDLVWMEMGGLLAVPNIRGGGEYGEAWHQAGIKLAKQNVFDDFIAAAEWLIAEGYTSPAKLAISGASNGGLLVGACMAQRPELFGAALPAVGVMDMLRYHQFTIGWAWAGDYGTVEDPAEFAALRAYSPLHNLRDDVAYPATLITTADHDDRVVPAHSFKFAARLQAAHSGRSPVLIRIATRAGHGAGKPTAMRIEEAADRLAFLTRVLDVETEGR